MMNGGAAVSLFFVGFTSMKATFSHAVRLCLCGLFLETVLAAVGQPVWFSGLAGTLFLWGTIHLRSLHDGFSAAFGLSVLRLLLIGAGAIPILRAVVWESVWSLLIPLCKWIALACFADGFWALRLSRGLPRNRSAAATVFLQILTDIKPAGGMVILSTTVILYLATIWYAARAARELDACEDPPRIS